MAEIQHDWVRQQVWDLADKTPNNENQWITNALKGKTRITNAQDVFLVQSALSSLGYTVGAIDGVYKDKSATTSKTIEAVKKFQIDNGLVDDGQVWPLTFAKLTEKISTQKSETKQETKPDPQEIPKEKTDIPNPNRIETNTNKDGFVTINEYKDGKNIRTKTTSKDGDTILTEYDTNEKSVKTIIKWKNWTMAQWRDHYRYFTTPELYTIIEEGVRTSGIRNNEGVWQNALKVQVIDGIVIGEWVNGKYSEKPSTANSDAKKAYDDAVKLYPGKVN
jgi:peptidoglycan hydrolase-like protein with peptidoglycan-binding domain